MYSRHEIRTDGEAHPLHAEAGRDFERDFAGRFFKAVRSGHFGIHWDADKALDRQLREQHWVAR